MEDNKKLEIINKIHKYSIIRGDAQPVRKKQSVKIALSSENAKRPSVALYYRKLPISKYKYVRISIVNETLYLEFTNEKTDYSFAVVNKRNHYSTKIAGANVERLKPFLGEKELVPMKGIEGLFYTKERIKEK